MTSKERRENGMLFIADESDWSLVAGNPCKVIRKITEEDKTFAYKKQLIDGEIIKKIYG